MEKKYKIRGRITVNFGWEAYQRQYSGGFFGGLQSVNDTSVDCDAAAIFCGADGKPISKAINQCCVNYNNLSMFNTAVVHSGDNQKGDKLYDEVITINLDHIPLSVNTILLSLDVLKEKKKNFGKIQYAFLTLKNGDTGEEIDTNNIVGLDGNTKLVIAGKITRFENNWMFERLQDNYAVESMNQFLISL